MSAGEWRTALADALDEQAGAIDRALGELTNVHELLEARGRASVAQELRALASSLRSEATDLRSEARALRARPTDDHRMPAALTVRNVRGARP